MIGWDKRFKSAMRLKRFKRFKSAMRLKRLKSAMRLMKSMKYDE